MARGSGRQRVVDAAVTVLMRDGIQGMTLDATAAQAEVSKGGLLYHFKSKDDLLDAVIVRWLTEFTEDIEHGVLEGGESWSQSYLRSAYTEHDDSARERSAAMLLVLASESRGFNAVAEWKQKLRTRMTEELGEVDSALIIAVVDGLWYAQLLGLPMPSDHAVEEVFTRLSGVVASHIPAPTQAEGA